MVALNYSCLLGSKTGASFLKNSHIRSVTITPVVLFSMCHCPLVSSEWLPTCSEFRVIPLGQT